MVAWRCTMGCRHGKSECSEKPGRYKCKKCGARTDDKGHVCKPEKVKKSKKKDKKK